MTYLVDSDWIIDVDAGNPSAISVLEALRDDGLALSVITIGEVLEGAYLSANPQEVLASLRRIIGRFRLIDVTPSIAERFARERSDLRRQGNLITDLDLLIAATALTHNLTLITRNTRHFARIPGLSIYQPKPAK